jgi:putative flippase GtrA
MRRMNALLNVLCWRCRPISTRENKGVPAHRLLYAAPLPTEMDRRTHAVSSAGTRAVWNWLLCEFARFCFVGLCSTAIDLGTFVFLRTLGLIRLPANTLSFVLAVTTSFSLNRCWTFRALDRGPIGRQYLSFFIVNVVGFLLNTTILQILAHVLETAGAPSRRAEMFGKLAATPIVAVWNFSASRSWAFPAQRSREGSPGARAFRSST